MAKGWTRFLYLVADRPSARKAAEELEGVMRDAGDRGGEAWFEGMKNAYAKAKAELKEQFAAGKISADEYKRSLAQLGQAYNKELISRMQKLRDEGKLTDQELKKFTGTLKDVGTTGGKSFGLLAAGLKKAIAPLVGFFALRQVGRWGNDLYQAAVIAEEPWNRLAGALSNVGIEIDSVRESLEEQAKAFDRSTRWDDEDYADTLQTIIDITGDYTGSLRAVTIAADLAAAKKIDLSTAATLVGKAMVGETGTLSRYGIVIKDTDNALEVLGERFRGRAANDLNTHAGRVAQLSDTWTNFKEKLGSGITKVLEVTHAIELLTGAIQTASMAVDLMSEPKRLAKLLFGWGSGDYRMFGQAMLPKAPKLNELPPPYTPPPPPEPLTPEEAERRRLEAERREKAEWQAIEDRIWVKGAGKLAGPDLQLEQVPWTDPQPIEAAATAAAEAWSNPWLDAFEQMKEEVGGFSGLIKGLSEAFTEGGLRGLARYAKGKVQENVAAAIQAGAEGIRQLLIGNPVGASLAAKEVAVRGAAAGAWRVLAGAGGGGSAAGVAALGAAGNYGGQVAQTAQPRAEVHVYNNFDPFDPHRAAVQDWVWTAERGAVQRRGAPT
jgi:hypothetical protein